MADVNGSLATKLTLANSDAVFELTPVDASERVLGAPETVAGGIIYRMRGNDGTLSYPVYWESSTIDTAGANYSGPGPLTDIVVAETIGLP